MHTTKTAATKQAKTAKTAYRQAWEFFYANAGYSYDPKTETAKQGRAKCARRMARAESKAANLGYSFEWEFDQDGCIGCDCGSEDCACSQGTEHETLGCRMIDPNGDCVQDLWGICGATREYRRVVEAELALEELG